MIKAVLGTQTFTVQAHILTHLNILVFLLVQKENCTPFRCVLFVYGRKPTVYMFCQPNTVANPITFLPKNIPSVVHFYPNRWSMLVLSEPSQGGKMWKKKGEVVQLWCDLSTQENTVCVWHGKHTQWKESLLFTSANSKHFFVSVQPHR